MLVYEGKLKRDCVFLLQKNQNEMLIFSSVNALPVSTIYNAHDITFPDISNINILYVAPILYDKHQLQIAKEIVVSSHSHKQMGEKAIWLLGVENESKVDETSLIIDTFSDINLNFDDDVFIYVIEGGLLRLYEIYKIGQNDMRIIVASIGHWSFTERKLILSDINKYERRRDLMVWNVFHGHNWQESFYHELL